MDPHVKKCTALTCTKMMADSNITVMMYLQKLIGWQQFNVVEGTKVPEE